MSVWGKLSGAGLGATIGGPIGALVGAFAGHYLVDRAGAPFGPAPKDVVLTTGLIALAAKMARADGVVLRSEVEAFERVVIVPEAERPNVRRLFELAEATTAGYQAYAQQLARTFESEPALLDDIVEGLFLIAKADGALHEGEVAFLADVVRLFGRTDAWFESALARHAYLPDDPYRALGLERDASDDELRRGYRRLVLELHPDREIARGLPPEAIRIATERFASVNAAWDRIAAERGL